MSDTTDSLIRRAAVAACLLFMCAVRARAQSAAPGPAVTPPGPDFLPRTAFHLTANSLNLPNEDRRFKWDAYFGGDVDVFDYVYGRTTVLADYHPVLGDELRPFDPNQAYYDLEVASSYRAGGTEFVGVFHHVSRHLSDRPKEFAIAWNVAGLRAMRRVEAKRFTFDVRGDVGAIVQHSYVDYKWTADVDLLARRPLSSRLAFFAHGYGELFGVDGSVVDRGTQYGGRVEAGLRINGRGGALELFAGGERRLDADPIDRQTHSWGLAGFRLLSR
jgi:hypothetical protein